MIKNDCLESSSMSATANKNEESPSIESSTRLNVCENMDERQDLFPAQPQHLNRRRFVEEGDTLASPASSTHSECINSRINEHGNITTRIDPTFTSQPPPAQQFVYPAEASTQFSSQSANTNSAIPQITAALGSNLQERNLLPNGQHLLNQATRAMAPFDTLSYQPTGGPLPFVNNGALPFSSMITNNMHPVNQFLNQHHMNTMPISIPTGMHQQSFHVAATPGVYNGYQSIQDNGTVAAPQQYMVQSGPQVRPVRLAYDAKILLLY